MTETTKSLLKRISVIIIAHAMMGGAAARENAAPKEDKITSFALERRVGKEALFSAFNWSDILIVPSRLEAGGENGAVNLYVQNRFHMARDFQIIYRPGQIKNYIRPNIRYTPRKFSLQPGQVQVVRVQASALGGAAVQARLDVQMLPMMNSKMDEDTGKEVEVVRFSGVYGASVPVKILP